MNFYTTNIATKMYRLFQKVTEKVIQPDYKYGHEIQRI